MSSPTPANAPTAQDRVSAAVRILALLSFFTAGAWAELRQLTALSDADVWWRLRTGLWMAQMRALPSHGLFTRAAGSSWTASGWCFNLLLAAGYSLFGLAALPLTVMLARCVLAMALFVLAGGSSGQQWLRAVALAAVGLWLVGPLACGPLALSMILYGAELALLIHARRSGRFQILYALPALFFLWANLAPEFVWGFLPLVLLAAAEAARAWAPAPRMGEAQRLPLIRLSAVTAVSAAAPLFAPYSYRLYANFFAELYNLAAFKYFPQLHALGFRQPRDFAVALFVLGAFFALGRRHDLFLSLLLLLSLPIAFRIQRDAWLALLPATAAYSMFWQPVGEGTGRERLRLRSLLAPALLALLAVLAGGFLLSPARIHQRVAEVFPQQAVEFIRSHALPGPLFHLTPWGGYLTFALPEYPVTMDDRIAIYGEADYVQMQRLAIGEVPLNSVPAFAEARTLLLPADSGLAKALITLPEFREHYRVLYRDALAVVLEHAADPAETQ